MKTLISTLFILSCSIITAQYSTDLLPRISSDNQISERVAYTDIEIKYGSPKVKGREIWGNLEQYDQIWRAGANMATTISFSQDVLIQDQKLKKGIYSFFVIPRKNENWTLIFNNVHDQWGAFNYDQEEDALRINVRPKSNRHTEDLTYDVIGNGFASAWISLAWEEIKIDFEINVQYLNVLEDKVKHKVKIAPEGTDWVVYLQAAEFLVVENKKLDLAEEWLDKSLDISESSTVWSGQYYPKNYVLGHLHWVIAKHAALQGDYNKAISFSKKMKDQNGDYNFYEKENDIEDIDHFISAWEKKLED